MGLDARVDVGSWEVPAVIQDVIRAAALSTTEALRTFNMGIGMALICPPKAADDVIRFFLSQNEQTFRIGEVTASASPMTAPQVLYRMEDGS
jgi:phosphoribosylformylglycinamidine cyclo-ligase